ncbi:hypothetical protein [Candidatus Thiosymbion oneisti]|uniref:hypothetical protein n=1 Tax=Candidatus Thiosymbion oneisti TaxID=589554 RepID=UPI00105FAA23|nr:hypothetical protein [Candidatus Thiosymbion oneisti]
MKFRNLVQTILFAAALSLAATPTLADPPNKVEREAQKEQRKAEREAAKRERELQREADKRQREEEREARKEAAEQEREARKDAEEKDGLREAHIICHYSTIHPIIRG